MKVPDTSDNQAQCICPGCPTYNDCMTEGRQTLFCARSKTDCGPEKQGCLCGACPVASQYRLTNLYYCLTGASA